MGKAQRSRVEWLFDHVSEIGQRINERHQINGWLSIGDEKWDEVMGKDDKKGTFASQGELVAHLRARGYYHVDDKLDGEGEPVAMVELDYRALLRYFEHRNPITSRQPVHSYATTKRCTKRWCWRARW